MRCHTRNRSEAPLLEGDFTDEEEEEKEESVEVVVIVILPTGQVNIVTHFSKCHIFSSRSDSKWERKGAWKKMR